MDVRKIKLATALAVAGFAIPTFGQTNVPANVMGGFVKFSLASGVGFFATVNTTFWSGTQSKDSHAKATNELQRFPQSESLPKLTGYPGISPPDFPPGLPPELPSVPLPEDSDRPYPEVTPIPDVPI